TSGIQVCTSDGSHWETCQCGNAGDFSLNDGTHPDGSPSDGKAIEASTKSDTGTPDGPKKIYTKLSALRAMNDGGVSLELEPLYATYLRGSGFYLQGTRSGPAIYVSMDPGKQNIKIGNKIQLHVIEIGRIYGNRTITKASISSNDYRVYDVDKFISQDLSAATGTTPNASLESKLVRVTKARKISGARGRFLAHYGSSPTEAKVEVFGPTSLNLCQGATFDIARAYIFIHEVDGKTEYLIRSHLDSDLVSINKATCPVVDSSNWGFENWDLKDPIEDFAEDNGKRFTIEPETTLVHGGKTSAKVTWSGVSTDEPEFSTAYRKPVSGTSSTCRVWTYDNDPDGRARLFLRWWDAGGGVEVGHAFFSLSYSIDGAGWQELSLAKENPVGAVSVTCGIRLYHTNAMAQDGKAVLYFDDLTIE
ncbi:MAG: hypothetical protein KAI47_22870, partial [Deltaproteobacteria bacterium]|nr:hypothetical protein [Deltaproteobacteria bacterium]